MAGLALEHGQELLRADPSRVLAAVEKAAAGGSHYAALALVAADADTTAAVPLARQRLEAAVAARVHEPGVSTFGTGLPQIAWLMTVLPEDDQVRFARGMLDFAGDHEETAPNRIEALHALRGIARHVPDDVRDELFELVVPFAEGRREPDGEAVFVGGNDPLARFRFSFGDASLVPAGLLAVAALARTPDQCSTVQQNAVAQLSTTTDQSANSIAAALATLPPGAGNAPAGDSGEPSEPMAESARGGTLGAAPRPARRDRRHACTGPFSARPVVARRQFARRRSPGQGPRRDRPRSPAFGKASARPRCLTR
jgi:hypothetical protein